MRNLLNPQSNGFIISGSGFTRGLPYDVIDGKTSTYVSFNPTKDDTYIIIRFDNPVLIKEISFVSGYSDADRYFNGADVYFDDVKHGAYSSYYTIPYKLPEYKTVTSIKLDFRKRYMGSYYSHPTIAEIIINGRVDYMLLQDAKDENKLYGLSDSTLVVADTKLETFMSKGFEPSDLFIGNPKPFDQVKNIAKNFKLLAIKK